MNANVNDYKASNTMRCLWNWISENVNGKWFHHQCAIKICAFRDVSLSHTFFFHRRISSGSITERMIYPWAKTFNLWVIEKKKCLDVGLSYLYAYQYNCITRIEHLNWCPLTDSHSLPYISTDFRVTWRRNRGGIPSGNRRGEGVERRFNCGR